MGGEGSKEGQKKKEPAAKSHFSFRVEKGDCHSGHINDDGWWLVVTCSQVASNK